MTEQQQLQVMSERIQEGAKALKNLGDLLVGLTSVLDETNHWLKEIAQKDQWVATDKRQFAPLFDEKEDENVV